MTSALSTALITVFATLAFLWVPPFVERSMELGTMDVSPIRSAVAADPDVPAGEIAPIRPRCHGQYIARQADGGRWTANCVRAHLKP